MYLLDILMDRADFSVEGDKTTGCCWGTPRGGSVGSPNPKDEIDLKSRRGGKSGADADKGC